MNKYRVAIVGVGAVGKELVKTLKERQFPFSSLTVIARTARKEEIGGDTYAVEAIEEVDWSAFDLALFAGTEGEKGASQLYGWKAVEAGAVVIDNGDDFRMDERVPLVIPEVNGEDLEDHQGFVANPNCSTIQMAAALWPLHQAAGLKEVVVSTYQAVSGSGAGGIAELEGQIQGHVRGEEVPPRAYDHAIFSNVIPQISSPIDDFPGYYKEEAKMIRETRKIFHAPELTISATCVRVPVFNSHSEAITARFERKITPGEAREILSQSQGLVVEDNFEENLYPLPARASGRDPVYVGRLRQSTLGQEVLEMWVVADNLRKGAALNAIQIAESLVEKKLLGVKK